MPLWRCLILQGSMGTQQSSDTIQVTLTHIHTLTLSVRKRHNSILNILSHIFMALKSVPYNATVHLLF